MILEILLASTLHAAPVSFAATVTGGVDVPRYDLPCAKIISGERVTYFFNITRDLMPEGTELHIEWMPPLGTPCVATALTVRNPGRKSAYRTYLHPGLDPCGGIWGLAVARKLSSSGLTDKYLLTDSIGVIR